MRRLIVVAAALLAGVPPAWAQSEIRSRFLASAGDTAEGLERFRFTAESTVQTPSGPLESSVEVYFSSPDRYREDSRLPFGEVVTVRDGATGWARTPRGVRTLTDEQLRRTEQRLYRSYLGLLWAAGHGAMTLSVEPGEEASAGVRLRVAEIAAEADFDEATGRLVQIRLPGAGLRGEPVVETRWFSEFAERSGLVLPGRMDVLHDGALVATERISELAIGGDLPDSLFERPAPSR